MISNNAYLIQYPNLTVTINHAIPYNTAAIIAFGGDQTNNATNANYYTTMLHTTLIHNGIRDMNVYGAFYDIDGTTSACIRTRAFKNAGRKVPKMYDSNDISDTHIYQLYDMILRPRLFDYDGKKLSPTVASERVGKLKFYAHCHGAVIIHEMANIMTRKMKNAGYTDPEIKQIQQQLLVLQYAPLAPLEHAKFTTISFASAADWMMRGHRNCFADYMNENSNDVLPMFFDASHGNIFAAGHLKQGVDEHKPFALWQIDNPEPFELTNDGKIIFKAMRNALVRGALHSTTGGPLPEIKTLTNGYGVDFNKLRKLGDWFYTTMVTDLRNMHKHK